MLVNLWAGDGTPGGTLLVKSFNKEVVFNMISRAPGDRAIFTAMPAPQMSSGCRTEPPVGTTAIKSNLTVELGDVAILGGSVLFAASDTVNGYELWTTDLSPGGTVLLKELSPGKADGFPNKFSVVGSRAFFDAGDGVHGRELWSTDGSPGGTIHGDLYAGPVGSNPSRVVSMSNKVYFSATETSSGREIWSFQP